MHSVLAAVLVAALSPQAQGGMGPKHRPEEYEFLRTETGYVLPEGVFEADATLQHLEFDEFRRIPGRPDITAQALVAELAYGITDWVTAEVEVPFRRLDFDPGSSESGIGDIGLEGKVSLKRGPSPIGLVPDIDLAAGARVTLPTGDEDEGLGEENATFGLFVSTSHWIEKWFGLHGWVQGELQEDRRPVWRANAAAEFAPWDPAFSLFGALDFEREGSDSPAVSLIPGAQYRFPAMPLALGAGLPLGLSSRAADWGLLLNGEFRF